MRLSEILQLDQQNNGVGVEISIDPKTAKKSFKYFEIKQNKDKRQITQEEFKKISGQYYNSIESSIENLLSYLNNRKRFAPDDVKIIDVIGYYDFENKAYKIVATSDSGDLQLVYNHKIKRWE